MDMTSATWRTSSYSGGNCVEVSTDDAVAVRYNKKPSGPVLAFAANTWTAFTERLKGSS